MLFMLSSAAVAAGCQHAWRMLLTVFSQFGQALMQSQDASYIAVLFI
jgi:hypothetical protein